RPPKELDGAVVGVTDETSTSVEILRLLLATKYAVAPQAWVDAASPSDAVLLIGDQALRALHGGHPAPYRIDVGTEWVEWTGLPCVFARWGVRASLGAPAAAELADGLHLLTAAPLLELGALAHAARFRRLPEPTVTFVIDSNPNYTNVCVTDCQFCAFYRKPGAPEAYTLTVDQVLAKVEAAAVRGA